MLRLLARHLNFMDATMNGAPVVFSKRGYWLNPNSGDDQPLPWVNKLKYHYYPPHLRNTPVSKTANHILVLGDSFTFGWFLPWEDTYVYQLQDQIDRTFGKNIFQLLNAGVGGWGTADQLAYLEEYGAKTSPKYVLVFLNTDDIGRSIKRNIYKLSGFNSSLLLDNFHPLTPQSLKVKLYNSWIFKNSVLIHFVHYSIHLLFLKHNEKIRPFSH
ncbi:MAG: SGNH/GDSL hydrolase family protein [Gammaproteobacteria bacterium]|nr:SGNH/GDSL hydrolase family protein [Gammaproteobacteria bacterium]